MDFPNDDPIFHNVFSLTRGATFDLGRYPRGDTKSRRFDHPYFARLDAQGRFRLAGFLRRRCRVFVQRVKRRSSPRIQNSVLVQM